MCNGKYCKEMFAQADRLHDYYINEINELKPKLKDSEDKYMRLVKVYVDKLLKDENNG